MAAARKRFFISYSRNDKDLVEPVVALLRTAPTEVFFDIDTIEPGEKWSVRLERAIKEASKFVIFWCDHSAKSRSVRREWMFALDNNKQIIPVLLDSTRLPVKLEAFQWIDFRPFANALHGRPEGRERAEDKEIRRAMFQGPIPESLQTRLDKYQGMAELLRERLQKEA